MNFTSENWNNYIWEGEILFGTTQFSFKGTFIEYILSTKAEEIQLRFWDGYQYKRLGETPEQSLLVVSDRFFLLQTHLWGHFIYILKHVRMEWKAAFLIPCRDS